MSLCLKCYFDSLSAYVILFNIIIKPFCMYTLKLTHWLKIEQSYQIIWWLHLKKFTFL